MAGKNSGVGGNVDRLAREYQRQAHRNANAYRAGRESLEEFARRQGELDRAVDGGYSGAGESGTAAAEIGSDLTPNFRDADCPI
jgi:hypothetical protein